MKSLVSLPWLAVLSSFFLSLGLLQGQSTNVLTWRNNNWRDGVNRTEVNLTQETVSKQKFGKTCSTKPGAIDGQIYAQPLVVTGSIPGHNHIVYVATMNDSVYFIDGDSPDCQIISHKSLLGPKEQAVSCAVVGHEQCTSMSPLIGIVGTPVIDISSNTIYLVTWVQSTTGKCPGSKAPDCFTHRIHALDITTGAEKFNGPVTIPSVEIGQNEFTSYKHLQRAGLLLLPKVETNGNSAVYVAFTSMDGAGRVGINVPNGWLFGFDAQDLTAPPVAWTTTPNGEGGGLWMTGAGIAAGLDKPGGQTFLYVATGDGTFDAENGGSDYGDSLVKLTTGLTVEDYFTPYRQYCDEIQDRDLGSGGVLLLPNGLVSSTTFFAIASGKDGNLYLADRANLGHYSGPASTTCPAPPPGPNFNLETVAASTKQFYSTPAVWSNNLFAVAQGASMQKFNMSETACKPGPICHTPTATSAATLGYGAIPVLSSTGGQSNTAIVWVISGNGWPSENPKLVPAPAVLYAYDAEHVTKPSILPELWDSTQCPKRDRPGSASKFTVPTVANGHVYIGTMDPSDSTHTKGRLDVYGGTTAACQ